MLISRYRNAHIVAEAIRYPDAAEHGYHQPVRPNSRREGNFCLSPHTGNWYGGNLSTRPSQWAAQQALEQRHQDDGEIKKEVRHILCEIFAVVSATRAGSDADQGAGIEPASADRTTTRT